MLFISSFLLKQSVTGLLIIVLMLLSGFSYGQKANPEEIINLPAGQQGISVTRKGVMVTAYGLKYMNNQI